MRAAIYARYSSDLQSERSIDDQVALCRKRAETEDWKVCDVFTDYALSGATMERPGLRALIDAARASRCDVVLAESLDRLSRDQEDIAGLYKRLTAWGVAIVTLSEGAVSELHIGLKGTMNALFLKDLAAKSLRGQLGKARAGYAAGGIAYGYEVVREFDDKGELVRGKRRIVDEYAQVIRRIFSEFATGRSSLAIAKGLNADGIPSPRGGQWNPSTIYGHRKRGVGIICNPIYVGRQVFNRHSFLRDPDTGSRKARRKSESDWVEADVPELAIIDPGLWEQAQARIQANPEMRPERHRRPKRLFSGLIYCGDCGGPITIVNKTRYGCAAARQKGTCNNKRTMEASAIEQRILGGLKDRLLEQDLVQTYLEEYHSELQRLQKEHRRNRRAAERERADIKGQIDRLVTSIAKGTAKDVEAVCDKLRNLEGRLRQLEAAPTLEPSTVQWHPNAVDLYKLKVADLAASLNADPLSREEAVKALRGLIDRIVAKSLPAPGQFDLELHGHLAAALNMARHVNDGGEEGIRTLDTAFDRITV